MACELHCNGRANGGAQRSCCTQVIDSLGFVAQLANADWLLLRRALAIVLTFGQRSVGETLGFRLHWQLHGVLRVSACIRPVAVIPPFSQKQSFRAPLPTHPRWSRTARCHFEHVGE
jgi:hypothetical protein